MAKKIGGGRNWVIGTGWWGLGGGDWVVGTGWWRLMRLSEWLSTN